MPVFSPPCPSTSYDVCTLSAVTETEVMFTQGSRLSKDRICDDIANLHEELAKKYPSGNGFTRGIAKEGINQVLAMGNRARYIGARRNGQIVGIIEAKTLFESWLNAYYFYLDNIVVGKRFWRQRIGTALMDYAKQLARSQGYHFVRLYHFDAENAEEACVAEFLKGTGFKEIGKVLECSDFALRQSNTGFDVRTIEYLEGRRRVRFGVDHLPADHVVDDIVRLQGALAAFYKLSLDTRIAERGVEAMIAAPERGGIVVARSGNQTVGVIEVKKPYESWHDCVYWYLDNFYVDQAYRGGPDGAGAAIMNYVKARASLDHVKYMRLYVGHDDELEPARRFYNKHGFKTIGTLMQCEV